MTTKQNKRIEKLLKSAEVTVHAEQDICDPLGNVLVSGDAEVDAQAEREVFERLDRGDIWAWATVKVFAEVEGIKGESQWLGGCNYASESDFRESGCYFDDMKAEAIADLRAKLENLAAKL